MPLDKATEEYIKKHFFIKDGKLYKIDIKEVVFDNNSPQFRINGKNLLKTKILEYLQTGKCFDRRMHKNNVSGNRGVSYHRRDKKWLAFLRRNGCNILSNSYKTKEEAIEAYNKALEEYNYTPKL